MRKHTIIRALIPIGLIGSLSALWLWHADKSIEAYRSLSGKVTDIPERYHLGKVLILVPHQDDEANLASGILESLSAQNEVFIAFSTNGDYVKHGGDIRVNEALAYADYYHIPKDHVIYLGYGDGYDPCSTPKSLYKHLYNSDMDEQVVSHSGRTMTEGVCEMPSFRPSKLLSRRHFKQDIEELIESIRPDAMIVVDYDAHPDHRALSCMFEEALNDVLRRRPGYTPTVLKGFAYSTTWEGPIDGYSYNIRSTRAWNFEPDASNERMPEVNWARWEDRIRFPVAAKAADNCIEINSQFIGFSRYATRSMMFGRVINGDKIFWWRPTNSVLRDAEITCTSGNSSALTDFKLSDSDDITNLSQAPTQHGWYPDGGRGKISVTFPVPRPISEIRLYDDTEIRNQVLSAKITLTNGREYHVSDIDAGGAPKRILTECHDAIDGFTIEVEKGIGACGLAEIEAFSEAPQLPFRILKLMDDKGDFIYSYHTGMSGNVFVSLWRSPGEQTAGCRLILADGSADIEASENGWDVHIPYGESATLQVMNARSVIVDQVVMRHLTLSEQLGRYLYLWHSFATIDFPRWWRSRIYQRFIRLYSYFF